MSSFRKVSQVSLLIKACFTLTFFDASAQVGFPYCETFQENSTQSATVFGGDARLIGGVLRLTNNEIDQNGYVYVDIPFSSVYGIKTSFEYFSYGGTGADGLTVFLFDAQTANFAPGGFGGSLGYAQRNGEQGLTNAYIGVGFDSFGNFGNSSEGRNGGFPSGGVGQLYPNSIIIRGPGNNSSGYPFVQGLKTNETGEFGLPADQLFPLSSGGIGTTRVTEPENPGYRKVMLNLEPADVGYLLTLEMIYTTEQGNPRLVTLFEKVPYPYPAPKDLKIGFAASTGGETNFHETRNMIVQVSNEDGLINPSGTDIFDKASCEGQENTYEIVSTEVNLPNDNSSIRCLQLFGSLEEIEAEGEDICAQGKCRPENRELKLPQGTFRASDEGGEFTFFPNYGFTDKEVTVYYTVTDNYGKTSSGNSINLLIKESPGPVTVNIEGYPSNLTEIRLCEYETVKLIATGEEEYVRYEWYRDQELIVGADVESIEIEEEGEYFVLAYNSKNCPTKSTPIELFNPPFPILMVIDPIVGCVPGQALDIRDFILGYNEDLYDYELETPDGDLLQNGSLEAIGLSGQYDLRIKHKDLSCWSEPTLISIFILEDPFVALFDFEVDGTGIKDDAGGGIFIDDPIRFIDQSTGDIIKWEWDFGDGNRSSENSPVHMFGKRGQFEIKLTIINDLGCESTYELNLSLTNSYRVMIPTGFTPEETENQFFRPKIKGIVKMEMLVFNMWGELIYKTDDLNTKGWDGRIENGLSPAGNYVYRLNMESIDGEQVIETGNFILIR